MLIKRPADIKPSEITSPSVYLRRRHLLQAAGLTTATILAPSVQAVLRAPEERRLGEALENVADSEWKVDDEPTPFKDVTRYNNFYEFGTGKGDPAKRSEKFKPKPWSVEVSGACEKPGTYDLEDIIKPHQLEERIYRLRCVEAWSMVVPWVGFPLASVLKRFAPLSNAKYVAFETLVRPEEMPGQKFSILPWPYVEGLRIDEAMNELTLLTVGLYGEVLPNQNGAPIRLMMPWKYGFKSIKSVVSIKFQEDEPPTSWNLQAPREYGFYANVNPKVNHPRWSQAKERRIGEFFKRDTLMFNGYGEQVASLYTGMDLQKSF